VASKSRSGDLSDFGAKYSFNSFPPLK